MIVLSAIRQRIADCLREQRIRDLQERIRTTQNRALARLWWVAMRDEINARSPAQVARMEKELGLTP